MRPRKTYMYISFQQNWVCRSVKPCTQMYLHNIASCIDLQLPIVILKKSIILDMHHHKTYMCINFQQNRVETQVVTVLTSLFAKNRKLHKFATTNNIFFSKIQLFQTCIIVERTCISIFSKIGLVVQSKPCTQIYLHNNASSINLQLPIVILKRINSFRHASS